MSKNIFQLWDENGRNVPFAVRRDICIMWYNKNGIEG